MSRVRTALLWTGCILGSVVLFAAIAATLPGGDRSPSSQSAAAASSRQSISEATPSPLGAGGRVAAAFTLLTDMTRMQVDQLEQEIRGTVIQWRGPVSEVDDDSAGLVVYVSASPANVAFECWITDPTSEDRAYAASLRRGQQVTCKGVIDRAATFGGLVLSPSFLVR